MTDMTDIAQVEGSMLEGVGWMVTITEEGWKVTITKRGWKEVTSKLDMELVQKLARVGINY